MAEPRDIKYSLIFLNYDPQETKDWVEDTRRQIIENSPLEGVEFIEVKNVRGYVNAVNEGLRKAKGEYLLILNDDIIINDYRWLEKLAQPNAITSWKKNPFHMNGEMLPDGACWCIHRPVFEKIGYMDEAYGEGYGCDEIDYFYRAKEAGFALLEAPVFMRHMQNKTYSSHYFAPMKEAMTAKNANYFYAKWKDKLQLSQA